MGTWLRWHQEGHHPLALRKALPATTHRILCTAFGQVNDRGLRVFVGSAALSEEASAFWDWSLDVCNVLRKNSLITTEEGRFVYSEPGLP